MRISNPLFLTLCLVVTLSFSTAGEAHSQSLDANKAEQVTQEKPAYVKGITSARARSLVGGVIGLLSIIIGWRAKALAASAKVARPWSIAALVLGLTAIVLSIVHLSLNAGGFGTGGGKAGAIVAIVLGVIGSVFGGLNLQTRST